MHRLLTIIVLSLTASAASAQHCNLTISGKITDRSTGSPLWFASIRLAEEPSKGSVSDIDGHFEITNACPGRYHLEITYVGFKEERIFVDITDHYTLDIELNPQDELLSEVVIHGIREENTPQISNVISEETISEQANKNLADMLEAIAGVSVLRNGSGISKPVIHGLYGNRITILNNGIPQAGQQWGIDHAPEIDPFVADHISVIKGASALEYGGNSLGNVILVEPDEINRDPHLHGFVNYIFQTNGRGHTVNTRLEQSSPWASWRFTGTGKFIGDTRAPDYYLTNTGRRELDLSLQVEKQLTDRWESTFYYSLFNADIGILRGSHIGNLTDLQEAIGRDEPYFTQDEFSYSINAPRQEVIHHLVKLDLRRSAGDGFLRFTYGGQFNDRREFDVRRSGRSDIPALSLQLFSHTLESTWDKALGSDMSIRSGIQLNYADNSNDPETGILPLIPDYESLTASGFVIWQKFRDRWVMEAGGRYDFRNLDVTAISRTVPRTIERFDHQFNNYSFQSGFKYDIASNLNLNLNVGYARRAPEVNELYSFGLHQGVSGIEEGSPDLTPEASLKGILSAEWIISDKFFVQALGYWQTVSDYIYLQPQSDFRLTIRGAFPVFIYEQTDARIRGTDWVVSYTPVRSLKLGLVYAMIRGRDTGNDLALINLPSDNISGNITWFPGDNDLLSENSVKITGRYVFNQDRIRPEQDFMVPPDGYFLLGLEAGTHIHMKQNSLQLTIRVENMLNESYRDYLDRLRYFADAMGLNVNVGLKYSF